MLLRPPKPLAAILCLIISTLIWCNMVHLLHQPRNGSTARSGEISVHGQAMMKRQLDLWSEPESRRREILSMRRSNSEWDFMGRTFLVLGMVDAAIRDPSRVDEVVTIIDNILSETLRMEAESGPFVFLMPYARNAPFRVRPVRSLFVDGEIALMLGARLRLGWRFDWAEILERRSETITQRLQGNPIHAVESYPDECWTFDHAVALAALRLRDHLTGTDNADLRGAWLKHARSHLIDPKSGLLVSEYTTEGDHLDGPEGSTLWMTAHCLRLVDESFAQDQYRRACSELKRDLCGFAWSREWPVSWKGPMDIDSGVVIPGLEASAGASGTALIAAASFGDRVFLERLLTSLSFAAFPVEKNGALRYAASNQVGDATIMYANLLGPLWDEVLRGAPSQTAKSNPARYRKTT